MARSHWHRLGCVPSEAKVASRSRAVSASFCTPRYFLGISLPLGHLHFCSWQEGGLGQLGASCVKVSDVKGMRDRPAPQASACACICSPALS